MPENISDIRGPKASGDRKGYHNRGGPTQGQAGSKRKSMMQRTNRYKQKPRIWVIIRVIRVMRNVRPENYSNLRSRRRGKSSELGKPGVLGKLKR